MIAINNEKYVEFVKKTENRNFESIKKRLSDRNIRLIHSIIGMSTEVGELQDQLKKHLFYGRELDVVNLEEEIGDLMWYIGIIVDELGLTFEGIQEKNIKKLKLRYGNEFDKNKAIKRNLEEERKILEE